jgi:acetyl-CoA/propionyl-CoA carboxylase biotin carboxyl carrier protein
MRVVHDPKDVGEALERSAREAQAYFGRPEVYLERYIEVAHHVEAQILADAHGNVSFLGERDCSLQRRYQKLVEETPSPVVDEELRGRIGEAALAIAKEAGYVNAGTVEFLVERDGSFYFMEVNARLQVEHPVTEMVNGLDLVALQIAVALGEKVEVSPTPRGHAIECRLNAEDPYHDFLPGPGLITAFRTPGGPFVRTDAGFARGKEIPRDYDSLFAKLVVWGEDRERARLRMLRALGEFGIEGVPTTIPFHRWVLDTEEFRTGTHHTRFVEAALAETTLPEFDRPSLGDESTGVVGGDPAVTTIVVEVEGHRIPVRLHDRSRRAAPKAPATGAGAAHHRGGGAINAPMQGTILQVLVEEGATVEEGQAVCILEAMKMENHIQSSDAGVVSEILVKPGQVVDTNQTLIVITAEE